MPEEIQYSWQDFRRTQKTGEKPSSLNCPRCRRLMKECAYGDLVLEECPGCQGCWYDKGELDRAVEKFKADDPEDEINNHVRRFPLTNLKVEYVNCPKCRGMMARYNYQGISGVIVDSCKSCGMWLDGGEFDKIYQFLKSGGLELRKTQVREQEKVDRNRKIGSVLGTPPHVSPDYMEPDLAELAIWSLWRLFTRRH
jgi:Zn-finger nucleic acid-binding protein